MQQPELKLSLSITDNVGSPLYAGVGQREHMGEFDSATGSHKITIIISDEEIGKVTIKLSKNDKLSEIELPTYKMSITDSKTEEMEFYEVTRDNLLFKELKTRKVGGFSLFGIEMFKSEAFVIPAIPFEPLKQKIDTFEVSKYRTIKEEFLAYTLRKEDQKAVLFSGKMPENFFETATDSIFCVIDKTEGQKFRGDILYREKFIRSIPKVEVQVIKRDKAIKEIELDKKGKINKIVYI